MPLDHYVSQVHLKNFYSPTPGERMYGLRKSDLRAITCKSEDVCRIEAGSTNPYLTPARIIEEFLKLIEPKYNSSIVKLRNNNMNHECIYVIAGFISYVLTCSPAGMRIFSEPLQKIVETTGEVMDAQGLLPNAPEELGGKSFSELLADGAVKIDIDPRYPQALGIKTILGYLSAFGNSQWEILVNDDAGSPFFTSDYPVAIEKDIDPRLLRKIVPLTPDIAVRIIPRLSLRRAKEDFTFSRFAYETKRLRHADVLGINQLIVRCAEEWVFYRDDRKWVSGFIEKTGITV